MTERELWNAYCGEFHINPDTPYEAWSFGDDPDGLARLVCRGIKTATCSLYGLYAPEEEPLPAAGDISVILDSGGSAVCVIRNTRVYRTAFRDISPEHALREGEGDRSLSYWRRVHADFFTDAAREAGLTFSEDSTVLCEEFEVLYRAEEKSAYTS